MKIVIDDLSGPQIAAFLHAHVAEMKKVTPPQSVHALDLEGLRLPAVTFWSVLDGDTIAGCGAIKELDSISAEVKSMRVAPASKRQGIASGLLTHMAEEARRRGYRRLSLETGSLPYFAPARALCARHGFTECGPFASYSEDPNSVYMTMAL
jgi:putative acetyltransferase